VVLVDGLAAFDAMIQAETDLLRACIELEIGIGLATATNAPLSPLQKLVSR
jgi:hypothetical protein